MEVLDTHVLFWSRFESRRLGERITDLISRAWDAGEIAVSAVTFWEIAMLQNKGRIEWHGQVGQWRQSLIEEGLVEIPMNGLIGIRAAKLADFHGDPADRQIVATALEGGHRLVTSDRKILRWTGPLNRVSAAG